MKIAFYYNLKFGGAKRVVKDQVRELSDLGHIVDIYTINYEKDVFSPEEFSRKYFNYQFSTFFEGLPIVGKLAHAYNSFIKLKRLQKEIARDIDKRRYDIVVVHPDQFTQAPFILRFLKTKTAYYCQEPYRIAYEHSMRIEEALPLLNQLFENAFRYWMKVVDRNNVRSASFTIASCNYVRERMIESYDVYPAVSYPGIDTMVFAPIKSKTKKGILFLGSQTEKIDGYEMLERALALLPKSKRLPIKFITWKKNNNERLTEKELVSIYSNSFITACMTRLETFGLIPLESMACGTPIIATNVSGHRETVVNGATGLLVSHEPEEIARAILDLINNPAKYKAMGKNGVKHVRINWDVKKKNEEFSKLLNKFVEQK